MLKAAELPNFRLYDLRHTFASLPLAQNAPITYVAAQLGHAKPTIAQVAVNLYVSNCLGISFDTSRRS